LITLFLLKLLLATPSLSIPLVKSPELFFSSHTTPNIPRSIDVGGSWQRTGSLQAAVHSTPSLHPGHPEAQHLDAVRKSFTSGTNSPLLIDSLPATHKAIRRGDYHITTRRWNNEYFNRVEASHLKTSNENEQSHWLNYCLPTALLMSTVFGNILVMVACLGVLIGFRSAETLWKRRRNSANTAKSEDDGVELTISPKRSVDISDEEEDMEDRRGDLPSWAID